VTKALSGVPDLFLGLGEAAGEMVGNARDKFGGGNSAALKVPNGAFRLPVRCHARVGPDSCLVIPSVTASVSSIIKTPSEPFIVMPASVKVVVDQLKWVHSMWTAPRPSAAGEKAMPDASVDSAVVDGTRLLPYLIWSPN